jgi:hypothetical protein
VCLAASTAATAAAISNTIHGKSSSNQKQLEAIRSNQKQLQLNGKSSSYCSGNSNTNHWKDNSRVEARQ